MKICNGSTIDGKEEFKKGHIYKWGKDGDLYMFLKDSTTPYIVNLQTNNMFVYRNDSYIEGKEWEDVTDQYCLTKVK